MNGNKTSGKEKSTLKDRLIIKMSQVINMVDQMEHAHEHGHLGFEDIDALKTELRILEFGLTAIPGDLP